MAWMRSGVRVPLPPLKVEERRPVRAVFRWMARGVRGDGPVESGCVALNVPLMRLCGAVLLVLPTALVASSKKCQIHHRAGASGYGGSSYIDSMLLREKDTRDSSDAINPPTPRRTPRVIRLSTMCRTGEPTWWRC